MEVCFTSKSRVGNEMNPGTWLLVKDNIQREGQAFIAGPVWMLRLIIISTGNPGIERRPPPKTHRQRGAHTDTRARY